MSGSVVSFWPPVFLILFHQRICLDFCRASWLFLLPIQCSRRQTPRQSVCGSVFFSSACMHGSISFLLGSWLSSALLQAHHAQEPARLSGLSVFERVCSDVSLGESSLHSNNSQKSPIRSNLKDAKRVETCNSEVLAQNRKPQDANLC